MAHNFRDRVAAMGVAIQPTPGTFAAPNRTTDLMGVASLTNAAASITVADPTLTGAIWDTPPIVLGQTYTVGGSFPMRGPGGTTPPAVGAWPFGRIMQAAGFTELRNDVPATRTVQAGSVANSIVLASTEPAIDDTFIGWPISHPSVGTGFRSTTLVRDYQGPPRTAVLAEVVGTAPAAGSSYMIPAFLLYILGTLTTAPPLLSISVWRDKKRYDFRDCAITSLGIDAPVANEANQVFPSADFSMKGIAVGEYDDTTPALPSSVLNVPIPPVRGGKFYLASLQTAHQDMKVNLAITTGAASNQNQDAGQDGYDIQSGTRTIDLDLDMMAVADLDISSIALNQTLVPIMSTWGGGPGNRWGMIVPNALVQPLTPGSRNGYVNLTGQAAPNDVDKSIALTIWY
jgi:hypothetical protein